MVQGDARQLVLHVPKQEEVRRRQVWQIGRVAEDLEAVGGQPILDDGGGVDRGVVPVEKPPLVHQGRSFLLHVFHEDVQDLHDVNRINCGPLGDDV